MRWLSPRLQGHGFARGNPPGNETFRKIAPADIEKAENAAEFACFKETRNRLVELI